MIEEEERVEGVLVEELEDPLGACRGTMIAVILTIIAVIIIAMMIVSGAI